MVGGSTLDRYTFDDGGRLYTDGDSWHPSVSFVLNMREDPPGLRNYKNRTSEAKQNQKKFYTSNRGTLIHYELLSQLNEDQPWTDDEGSSEDVLKGLQADEQTGLTGDQETWEQYQRDKDWALGAWETIQRVFPISPENTVDTELFVSNDDVGYAGQFDLIYIDDDAQYVLADIKTSKRVYDKHLIQLAAYEHAVDVAIDRLEVLRVNPDTKTWEVSSSETWMESRDDLWAEFKSLREKLGDQRIEELKKRAKDVQQDT